MPGESDIGGLDGDIGTGAERDTDIGLCQRRRIVDAVTDEGDDATGRLPI